MIIISNDKLKKILGKIFNRTLNVIFTLWFKQKEFIKKQEQITYMELILFLINNRTNIIRIEILLKNKK